MAVSVLFYLFIIIIIFYLISYMVATSVICERSLFTLLNFSKHYKRFLNICKNTYRICNNFVHYNAKHGLPCIL